MKNVLKIIILSAAIVGVVYFIQITQKESVISPSPISQTPVPSSDTTSPKRSSGKDPAFPLTLPSGFSIKIFASNLKNPRDMVFSPGGTLLVSVPSQGVVLALPDKNHTGVASSTKTIIDYADHVHGLAFYKGKLFVAETTRVLRYNWNEKTLEATLDKVLFALPENNDHNNRTLTFDPAGNLYISVGSTCNVCKEEQQESGTVIISNANGDNPRIFAKGLRNAAFLMINPSTNQLWGTEMGRDYLGDNLPPDEINIIQENKDYGWPLCYGDKIHDTNFDKNTYIQDPCKLTQSPVFEIPAHSAPLGLTFIQSKQFPSDWQNDLLVAYHGSWNRSQKTGYKVVHMKVEGNIITKADDFLTGFLNNGNVLGRPVDLIFDKSGNLYISDDQTGNIYIVQKLP